MNKLWSIAGVFLTLAGCASAPPTKPREAPLAPTSLGLDTQSAPEISEHWWTAFGDPQLDRLVDDALAHSPTLALALSRLHAAQAEVGSARSRLLPHLSLDANEQRERFSEDYIIPPPIGGQTEWIGTAQANLSWSIDLFGKQLAALKQARSSAEAARLDATAARLAIAGAVTGAYIDFSRITALSAVADEAVRQRQAVLDLTSGRVRGGLESDSALKLAQTLLANARVEQSAAAAARELAIHRLAALIGRGADAYALTAPQLNALALPLPRTLPADLLARRADIAAAQARIDAASAGRRAARRAFYPDVDLVGAAGWAAIGLAPMLTPSALQYGAGPAVHLPLFQAGELRARFAGATARLDEAVADYNAAVVGAVRQTADAITEVKSASDRARAQRDALASAEEGFVLAERLYRSGLAPQLNVLTAEDLLIEARRQNVTIAAEALAARVRLIQALGGGYQPPDARVADGSASQQDTRHE